jgi:serine/threonine-protein kinase
MKTCPQCNTDYPDQHTNCPTDGETLIVSQELSPGSVVIGKYRIVEKLGQGGMGVVYLAEYMAMDDLKVALKFLAAGKSHNPEHFKRFQSEAKASFSLRHPNIVQAWDLDHTEDGSWFIAMDYVEGKSLQTALDEERHGFDIPWALELTRGIAAGLGAAHAKGMVHRDIKPENILLAHDGAGWIPKIADFGIVATKESTRTPTQAGISLMTKPYAAPEQFFGWPSTKLDGRTDLYALGGVLFEMLTGERVFDADSYEGWAAQHINVTPRLPSTLRPELANWTGLDGLVMRLLAKDRDNRPRDAEALIHLLDDVRSGPVQKQPEAVAESDLGHPMTVEEHIGAYQVPSAAPVPQPAPPPVAQPTPLPEIQEQKPVPIKKREAQKIPVWVWGALAVVVVMAVAAGLTAAHFFAPKPQPQQEQATSNQQGVIPPLTAGVDTNTTTTQPVGPQKTSHSTKTDTKTGTGGPSIPPEKKSDQAIILKPPDFNINVNRPTPDVSPVKPPTPQPSNADIEKQALALFTQKRFSEAIPLLDTACTGGSGEACRDLGNIYRDGVTGVGKDSLRAASLFSRACDIAPPKGCTNLGVMYHNGDGVPQDDTKAATQYSKACKADDAIGCSNLGSSYWFGRGVPQDDSHAAALYSRACDANNGAACSNLGNCYLSGRGVGGKDLAKARLLFIKGCGLNNQPACDQLKLMK